jgi:hypothetical protein
MGLNIYSMILCLFMQMCFTVLDIFIFAIKTFRNVKYMVKLFFDTNIYLGVVVFFLFLVSSSCQRQCELLPSLVTFVFVQSRRN